MVKLQIHDSVLVGFRIYPFVDGSNHLMTGSCLCSCLCTASVWFIHVVRKVLVVQMSIVHSFVVRHI